MSRIAIDEEAIRRLAALLEETGLTEIEIAEGESRLRVARATAQTVVAAAAAAPAAATTQQASASPDTPPDASHPGAVLSPMVGVAYLSPEPGAPPFVKVGDTVAQGQTLLLIEAMKTFNQIKAPRAGVVRRILVESGAPVEYGDVLMIIE
ncbi:acetyl-CoA carboxylase biotin carboxyl carrier protein [Elioraea thermophila]|uniref:acetyl-CoA carboxylase biotin carboxyl carrier protein n=1 Tax=Elioraea thermophila TaxID=2185104 RepID=UPI000DF12395|nr:acetyl-CoA carboxylase biotin carboxyl carrier protein [Elioraea thermophila]